ncbi:MAG: hypothetical protein JWO93_871 [Micrococcaceae bacterium]|nr:hypothetical protein [Micrococcaceae bacterium]
MPELQASYVGEARGDASGDRIALDGGAFLRVAFRAEAHDEDNQSTLRDQPGDPASIGLPGLRSYVMTGDYEGILSITLGQATKAGFKVGRTSSGGTNTVYVDVRRP